MIKTLPYSRAQIWTALLFIGSALYLIYELAFNSRIVDGSTGDFSPERMEALELQGRILSGIGLTLLCLRFLSLDNIKVFFIKLSVISVLAFSLMFFGQKILIEYLVDSSTTEDRINAQHISILKKGILEQHVVLEDLSIPNEAVGSPAAKSMVSIMGAMIFNSDDFIHKLKENADEIVETIAKTDAQKTWTEAYAAYQEYQRGVNDKWLSYADGVNQFDREKAKIRKAAATKADEVYEEAGRSFQEKSSGFNDKQKLTRSTLELKRAVSDYFESKRLADEYCARYDLVEQKCHIKIENAYRDIVIAEAGRYIPPDYWCYPEKKEVVTKNIRGRKVSSIEKTQDCESMDREWFENKLLALSGNEKGIGDNVKVATAVRERLAEEGIVMPDSWLMSDKQAMVDQFIKKGEVTLYSEYRKKVVEQAGQYIPPTLTQEEFLELPLVQNPIKNKLDWQKNSTVPLDLDSDDFFEKLHAPRYIKPMQEVKNELLSDGASFGNGKANEDKGKNYYRSIIVPPFAMSFSLFFGLLNLFSFSVAIATLVIRKQWLARLSAYGVIGTVFIAYPLVSTSVAVRSEAFDYFGEQLSKETNPAVTHLAAWVIDAQPIMYPIGNALAGIAGQSAIEDMLLEYVPESGTTESAYSSKVEDTGRNYQDKAEDIKNTASEAPEDIGNPDAELQEEAVPASTSRLQGVTFHKLSVGTESINSHSIELLTTSINDGKSPMIDVSPIGDPENEDWVIYDSKVTKGDVCFMGERTADSLYHLKPSTWRVARHGDCSDSQPKMPSVGSMMRSVNRSDLDAPVIIQLNEGLTGEVYCSRYRAVVDDINKLVDSKEIIWSTPSRSVLGCFADMKDEDILFSMPRYASKTDELKSKDHSKANLHEWDRLKKLEKGAVVRVDSLSPAAVSQVLTEAPFLTGLIIDEKLITKDTTEVLNQKGKWLLSIQENGTIRPLEQK